MSKTNKVRTLSFRLAEDDYQKLVERCPVKALTVAERPFSFEC